MRRCRRASRRHLRLLRAQAAAPPDSPESPSCGLTASALRAMLPPRTVRRHALCPQARATLTAVHPSPPRAALPRRRGCRCSGGVRCIAARRQHVQRARAPRRPLPLPRPVRCRSQGRGTRRAGTLRRPRRTRARRRARRGGGQRACCRQPQARARARAHGPAAGHRQAAAAEGACELAAPHGRHEGANRARRGEAAPDEQQRPLQHKQFQLAYLVSVLTPSPKVAARFRHP